MSLGAVCPTLLLLFAMPKVLRMDNGPDLVSQALQQFCEGKVGLSYIPPGTPWNNGYIESFNRRSPTFPVRFTGQLDTSSALAASGRRPFTS